MNQQRTLQPGDELGGYTLIRPLGSGGTGQVWEVQDPAGYSYALKLLHPNLAADETARLRLAREAQILARINNSGVLYLSDLEIDGTDPFVVTELIRGQSLKQDITSHGPYPLTEALGIAQRLLEILESVHAAGILHRDLKPSNILLGSAGPVLIDFGIAQLEADERITHTGMVSGTPGWVSPEVISGSAPTVESDWWGWVGTLLYMLTGRPPFGTGNWQTVLSRVTLGQADTRGLPQPIAQILLAGLAPLSQGARPQPRQILAVLRAESARENDATLPLPTNDATVHLLENQSTLMLPTQETPSEITSTYPQVETPETLSTYPMSNPYLRKHVPIFSGTILFLLLGCLPFTLGQIGILITLLLLLIFSLIGQHRSWLRHRHTEYGHIRTRDYLLAWIRLPLHLFRGLAAIIATTLLTQTAITAGWYLSSLNRGWPGLTHYQSVMLRPAADITQPYLWGGNSWYLVIIALCLSGIISVTATLLGPGGKHILEGVAAATLLIRWPWLRILILLCLAIPVAYLMWYPSLLLRE